MPLLVLTSIFSIIIILNLKGVKLGFSLVIASLLTLFLQKSIFQGPRILVYTLTEPTTLNLLISINLIQILGAILQDAKVLQRLVCGLHSFLGNVRSMLALIPVLMALIPGPGVILLSAPILDEAAKGTNLNGTEKAYLNYWFRTSVQTSSPITFAFLLATSIVNVDKFKFFINLFPWTLIMLATGYFLQLRYVDKGSISSKDNKKSEILPLVKDLLFIWIVLVLYLGLSWPFSVSISCSILWVIYSQKVVWRNVWCCIKSGVSLNLTLMMFGIMLFSNTVETTELMSSVIIWSQNLGIPTVILTIIIPFLIGVVIGTYAGSTALVFSLFGSLSPQIPYFVMIFIISRIGNYISPVNSSILLCKEYFTGNLLPLYLKLYKSVVPMAVYLLTYLALNRFNLGL